MVHGQNRKEINKSAYPTFLGSWPASSAATRIGMLGAAENGARQILVGVGIAEIVVNIVIVNPVGGLALALAVAA